MGRAMLDDLNDLLAIKMRVAESSTGPRWHEIHQFIESELTIAESYTPDEEPAIDAHELDRLLREATLDFEARL